MYALCFFGYGIGQKIFCNEDSMKNLELGRIAAAGAVSGLFTTPILAPGERLKCVMQVLDPDLRSYFCPLNSTLE